ncbi:MAG: hypothetical protein J6A28_02825 [Clostridia bacterium]|nr:hypothetical protein [Clostridia bacterium]
MRKTRAQKERTELNKHRARLKKEIAELELEIQQEEENLKIARKSARKHIKACTILKNAMYVGIALSVGLLMSAVICSGAFAQTENDIVGEAKKIAQTEEYAQYKAERIDEQYALWKQGEIDSKKLAENIQQLDDANFVAENFANERIKQLQKEDAVQDKALNLIGRGTAVSVATAAVCFVGDLIADRNAEKLGVKGSHIEEKIYDRKRKLARKEEELSLS